MEGGRPPGGGGARGDSFAESATLLDELMLAERRADRQRIEIKRKPRIGEELGDVIAGEIVPRLMLMHGREARRAATEAASGKDTATAMALNGRIPDFAELVIRHESEVVEAYVRSLMQRGLDLETLLLHLFAPAARRLGALWEADEISFVDVTIGTGRLQELLRVFAPSAIGMEDGASRRVFFAPTPGEQHTLGLLVVTEFFRREGWQVHSGIGLSDSELIACVAEQRFILIGLSLSCDRLINTLCSTIQKMRRSSRNPSVLVMVGGSVFAQGAERRPWVGADLVAADAREALELAEEALRKIASRQRPRQL